MKRRAYPKLRVWTFQVKYAATARSGALASPCLTWIEVACSHCPHDEIAFDPAVTRRTARRILKRLSGHLDSATRERVYRRRRAAGHERAPPRPASACASTCGSRTGRTWTTPREPIPKPIPPGKD